MYTNTFYMRLLLKIIVYDVVFFRFFIFTFHLTFDYGQVDYTHSLTLAHKLLFHIYICIGSEDGKKYNRCNNKNNDNTNLNE